MIQKFQKAERIFIPHHEKKACTRNLKNFISSNFQIPNDDLEKLWKFIGQDHELEKIIFELPDLIQKEIKYNALQLKFYNEFHEDYLQLEVSVITSEDLSSSMNIEYKLEQKLYELYENDAADKLLLMIEGYYGRH